MSFVAANSEYSLKRRFSRSCCCVRRVRKRHRSGLSDESLARMGRDSANDSSERLRVGVLAAAEEGEGEGTGFGGEGAGALRTGFELEKGLNEYGSNGPCVFVECVVVLVGMPNMLMPESLYVRLRFAAPVSSVLSLVFDGREGTEKEENGFTFATAAEEVEEEEESCCRRKISSKRWTPCGSSLVLVKSIFASVLRYQMLDRSGYRRRRCRRSVQGLLLHCAAKKVKRIKEAEFRLPHLHLKFPFPLFHFLLILSNPHPSLHLPLFLPLHLEIHRRNNTRCRLNANAQAQATAVMTFLVLNVANLLTIKSIVFLHAIFRVQGSLLHAFRARSGKLLCSSSTC